MMGDDPKDNAEDGAQGVKRPRPAFDPKALVRIRIDAEAFLRGHAEPEETCSIPGVGPVPVASARALLGDAILELVSDPLERDHWQVDFKKDGPTSIDNLARIGKFHHLQKTHRGWKLEGGPGQWRFNKPDRTAGADPASQVSGADPDSEVTDTAEAREARLRATPASDPPFQEGML
jgi:hypothetical protein